MKVLFIGDSITRGTKGVDWIKMIEKDHPYWTLENAGVNGDTLNKLSERLKSHLNKSSNYDVIVFQSGMNDILLSMFKHRGFWFQKIYRQQIKSGNIPLSPKEFEILLKHTMDYIQKNSEAQIVLPTLGCINEYLLAESNAKLFSYNSIIKKIAQEYDCVLADVSEAFQNELSKKKTQDYCADSFSNTTFLDSISCNMGLADILSNKRQLHLTIDGIHLNKKGAAIFKEKIEKAILLTKERALLFI